MSKDLGLKNISATSMNDLLSGSKLYTIPFFQREYSWTSDQWIQYFDDVVIAMKNEEDHFFGFITLKKDNTKENIEYAYEIIEGQQRITTLIIFIAAIRDICREMGFVELESDLHNERVLLGKSLRKKYQTNQFRLVLSRFNQKFFDSFILKQENYERKIEQYNKNVDTKDTNILIFSCYRYFYENTKKLLDTLTNIEDKKELLMELVGVSLDGFVIIKAEVENEFVAYNIFQTLNDRGLDLAVSDLLKVHLCTKAVGDDKLMSLIQDIWENIRECLIEGNMTDFLKNYWHSTRGVIKQTKLLQEIVSKITKKNDIEDFLQDLLYEVEDYESIYNPKEDYWKKRGMPEIFEALDNLQTLSKIITLPYVMAVVKMFKNKGELYKSLELMTIFVFRYLTIAEKESKVLEKLMSDLAIKIRKGNLSKVDQIKDELIQHDITDKLFGTTLETKEIKKPEVARYLLKEIESYLDPTPEKFSTAITLEHILPKKPNVEWKNYLEANNMDVNKLINKIGNLTLLHDEKNKKARNYIFNKKSEIYKRHSKLKLNSGCGIDNINLMSLTDLSSWNTNDIDIRQNQIKEICLKIWKLDRIV